MLGQGRVSAASAPAVKANCDPSRPDVLDRRRSLDKRILQCSTRCGEEKPQNRGSVRRLDAAVINESAWTRRLRANAHRNDLPVVLKTTSSQHHRGTLPPASASCASTRQKLAEMVANMALRSAEPSGRRRVDR